MAQQKLPYTAKYKYKKRPEILIEILNTWVSYKKYETKTKLSYKKS